MISAEIIRRAKRGDRDARDHVLEHALRFIQEDQYCVTFSKRVRDEFDDLSQSFVERLEARVSSWRENNVQLWLQNWWYQHVVDASRKSPLGTVPIDELDEDDNSLLKARQDKVTDYRRMEDRLARKCDRARVQDSLSLLPEGQRKVLKMRCWEGLKNHEIAEELEISESAVSSRIQRAKNNRKLREMLEILLDVRR